MDNSSFTIECKNRSEVIPLRFLFLAFFLLTLRHLVLALMPDTPNGAFFANLFIACLGTGSLFWFESLERDITRKIME